MATTTSERPTHRAIRWMVWLTASAVMASILWASGGCAASDRSVTHPENPRARHAGTAAQVSRLLLRMRDGRDLGHGSTVYSGDRFEILVRLERPAYVYLLQFYDGSSEILYPAPGQTRAHRPGLVRIPGRSDEWVSVDDNPGEETLYIVISGQPMAQVDAYVAETLGTVRRSPLREAGADIASDADVDSDAAPDSDIASDADADADADANADADAGSDSEPAFVAPPGGSDRPGNRRTDYPGDTSVLTRAVEIKSDYDIDMESAEESISILHITLHHARTHRATPGSLHDDTRTGP